MALCERGDGIDIHDKVSFDFYTGPPQSLLTMNSCRSIQSPTRVCIGYSVLDAFGLRHDIFTVMVCSNYLCLCNSK